MQMENKTTTAPCAKPLLLQIWCFLVPLDAASSLGKANHSHGLVSQSLGLSEGNMTLGIVKCC
jgi:hypothetical protein